MEQGSPHAPPSAAEPSGLTRERAVLAERTALLVIDVQYFSAKPGFGEYRHIDPASIPADKRYYFERIEHHVLPNIQRLQGAFRRGGWEIIYTVVENLTQDGRDRSLDYKISGFNVPRGSAEARVLEEIAPRGDEIVIPKTASSVFNATNIEYVLRNLGVEFLVMTGLVTNQCVESAVRDAADRGFLVTLVEDACGAYSQAEHDASLVPLKGYSRIRSTRQVVAELEQQMPGTGPNASAVS